LESQQDIFIWGRAAVAGKSKKNRSNRAGERMIPHGGQPGAPPGVEHEETVQLSGEVGNTYITCFDYSPDNCQFQEVKDLRDFISRHRPDWSLVRWINIDGLSDINIIQAFAKKYELHPLAVEDLLLTAQRPKVDSYGGDGSQFRARLFIIARMLQITDGRLTNEQISILLGHKTVLTFQENRGDVWDPIRQRLQTKGSRLRNNDASFLAYSLLDAIVDHLFPILEQYGDRLEELEESVIQRPRQEIVTQIHEIKRNLLQLRRSAWPMRETVAILQREPHECLSNTTRLYLRDVYDHLVQIIDLIETYRELASDLTDIYISAVSNRMNEIMKVLTVIGTIFIPLTFLAGVYGMNFQFFPELSLSWAYPAFWGVCVAVAGVMLYMFHRRGWL
jgi:magnesium transporter